MIKFFRKIRQQLITENKFSKYLIYAIGEIILVVFGILIALQVNNWNQNRIAEKAEIELTKNILNDLEADKALYKLNLSEADMLESLYEKLYRVGVQGLTDVQIQYPQDIRRIPSYDKVLDTDYSLISDKISNKDIRKQLLAYNLKQKRLGVYNQELRSVVVNKMRSFLAEKGMYKLDALFGDKKENIQFIDESELKELSKNQEFQQLMFAAKLKLGHLKEKLKELVNTNKELSSLIKKNI